MTESALLVHDPTISAPLPITEPRSTQPRRLPTVFLAALVGLASDIAPNHISTVVPTWTAPVAAVAQPSPNWVEAPPPISMSEGEIKDRIRTICEEAQYTNPLEESTDSLFYKKFVSASRSVEMVSFIKDESRNEEIFSFLDEHFAQIFKQGSPAGTNIDRWTDFRVIVVDDEDTVSYPDWDDQSRQNMEDPFVISTHFSAQATVVLRFSNTYTPGPANQWVGHHFKRVPARAA